MKRPLFFTAALAAGLFAACGALADTYTTIVTNSSAKQWIALRVQPTNAAVDYELSPTAWNMASPGIKWKCYRMEQGSNYYQTGQFLLYPPDGSGTQLDPGESAYVVINYDPVDPLQPVYFSMNPTLWPLDGTTVIVTPDNMQGWSIETNCSTPGGARARICRFGPGYFEANRPLIAEEYNVPLGEGSFYAELDYTGGPGSNATPGTAWLGTDTHNGVPLAGIKLSQIKTMKWFGFNCKIPTRTQHPSGWENYDLWWIFPRQPICLELTVESPDGSERLQFWFRPFQTGKVSGDNCGRQNKRWLWFDAINGTPQVQVTRRWYVYKGLAEDGDLSLDEVYWAWSDLIAKYGDWKLVQTSNDPWPAGYKSAGWDETTDPPGSPTCTATGKCLNFQVGARKGYCHIYGPDNEWEDGTYHLNIVNWAGYYWGFRGNIDLFTLGIDLNGDGDAADPGETVNYNFEPSESEPPVRINYITQKDVYQKPINTTYIQGSMELRAAGPAMENTYHRVCGKITNVGQRNVRLGFDDGSKPPLGMVSMFLIRNINSYYNSDSGYVWPGVGHWYTVWGWLEKSHFFPATPKPYLLWGSYFNLRKLYP